MAKKTRTPLQQRIAGLVGFSLLAGVLCAGMAVPAVVLLTGVANATAADLLDLPQKLEVPPQPEASTILASDGSVIAILGQDGEYRDYVTLDRIAPIMQQAIIAIEDHRFYEHGAIDLPGFTRALVVNAFGGDVQGASSITQQYVKQVRMQIALAAGDLDAYNAAVESTMSRKIAEMRYAIAMEQTFTKDEILERYLNIAYFGDQAYGVQAAAKHFFGVDAADLTLPQAAMIAGLVQNPSTTDPINNEAKAIERRDIVLVRMAELEIITPAVARAAMSVPFDQSKVVPNNIGCASSRYPFVCTYLEASVAKMPEFGSDPASRLRMLRTGGLTITLTIEPAAMDAAIVAVTDRAAATDPVVAATASVEPGTGKLLSMAQSRPVMGTNEAEGETFYNYAVDEDMGGAAGFQGGSTFKIFTLAAALAQGASLGHYYDAPRSLDVNGPYVSCDGAFNTFWRVGNFAGEAPGWITLSQATVGSINTYYAQLIRDVGVCQTVMMARSLGLRTAMPNPNTHGTDLIDDWALDKIPSFTLGAPEVSPLAMAEAFATFAARGVHCDVILIQEIKRADGTLMNVPDGNCKQVINEEVADGVSAVMNQVMYGGGAASGRVSGPWQQAGKTGTSDSAAAYWMVGFTRNAATTVAVAADNGSFSYWEGRYSKSIQGLVMPSGKQIPWDSGGTAGPIWRAVMSVILADRPAIDFDPYSPIAGSFKNQLTPSPSTPTPPLELPSTTATTSKPSSSTTTTTTTTPPVSSTSSTSTTPSASGTPSTATSTGTPVSPSGTP